MNTIDERLTDLKCTICHRQLVRSEVENEGERVVGYTCRNSSYDMWGAYRPCNWWAMVRDGGKKGTPRERAKKLFKP